MKMPLPLSQEILNAFVDNEIEGEERSRILEMEPTNQELADAICELRRLKELVKAARYTEAVNETCKSGIKKRNIGIKYVAASVLMALVVSLSFISLNKYSNNIFPTTMTYAPASTYRDIDGLLAAANKNKSMNLVFHLKSHESKQAAELLHALESVLQTSASLSHNLQVEFVVSGSGLHLLQKESSVYTNRISAIINKYHNVTFIACGKTLHRLQKKTNKNIQIINEAMLVASGPKWVAQRQTKGWAYILI